MIRDTIKISIEEALLALGVPRDMAVIHLDHPDDVKYGDYSSNIAMALFKSLGASSKSPYDLAQNIAQKIQELLLEKSQHLEKYIYIKKVEVVKPGFINFYLTPDFFIDSVREVLENPSWYGKNNRLWNKKIIIEHTNFNLFKPFHIGHLVNNAVGESLSRILEFQDVKLTRASYGSDIGLPVAKSVWGILKSTEQLDPQATLQHQINFIGKAYSYGSEKYDSDEQAKKEIQEINKKLYTKEDEHIQEIYEWGRDISLKYNATIYSLLHSKFDGGFWESEVAEQGKAIVEAGLDRGIFEKSEGAIIFPGEKYGLHNRVFITSQGLPTYEAKELGLTKKKFEYHDFDLSIIVTANEQDDYFKVVIKALEYIYPEIAARTKHISHGVLRLISGKMSSRLGNVITGEEFIEDIEKIVLEKMKERDMSEIQKEKTATQVAIAAIKYSILRQSIGKDIIFDPEKSLSFEGDSGPYLQYTYVRAKSIVAKAKEEGITKTSPEVEPQERTISSVERMLYVFPEIVIRACDEYAPQYIVTYLTELAGAFNGYYAQNKIVDTQDSLSSYKVALTEAVSIILKNGMYLLGIETPEKM